MTDLLSDLPSRQPAPLTVFQARLDAHARQNWQDVFAGFSTLRAITFSSSLEFLLDLAEQFEDMEIIFGAGHILTKTHLAPDAFAISSHILLSLLEQHVSPRPDWACPLSYQTYQAMRTIQFQRVLVEMIASHPENIILSRDRRFMRVRFGGDIRKAVAFEKSVPEFVFKGRISDTIKLDVHAMEKELGFAPLRNTSLLGRILKAWKKPG
ncbi:hypothetical protein [Komagataeibacter sp. FNDCF1]|uniref:hypothetical protein n=1 Tax=Komagataeibacter sp. FNDCF1 TaxID=2878681 RepID=UPI001E6243BE|nr:hypothetical protein [Komagataeibacter sp. FNDCF1]MCE2564557.1 hypothetical protein [Komagataeibacter sp. FNDCF1]